MHPTLPIRFFAALFLVLLPTARTGRFGRRTTLIDPSAQRVEACPPSLRQRPDADLAGPWQRLLGWLMAPAPHAAAPAPHQLQAVRADFLSTVSDIDGIEADRLRDRLALTQSLRELWHLRSEVYRVVAVARSQGLAEQRLGLLNRHFPTRTPKSQFATLL